MIKVVYCFRKRSGMSAEGFDRYWRDRHGPLGARIPGLRRLVQSRAIHVSGDARAPDYDGLVELWFDDVEALLRARASPEWHRSGLDEANFLDPTSTAYAVTEERTIQLP
ncbi:MAG TPA: EthD family reductase [Gemmatimonadaceae bacterium]|nr:EthD family reductase [Gemmatimonadaceae bacterium]